MRQLSSSGVSLKLESPWSHDTNARSRIVADGKDTGQVVTGEILEAVLEWKNHHLLFLTDDIPFEDSLRIYLFDAHWTLIDSASLSAMYSTGVFSDLELIPPNGLRFKFFGGITWKLELFDRAVFALPFSDPRGVSRPFSFHQRFKIDGRSLPETGA